MSFESQVSHHVAEGLVDPSSKRTVCLPSRRLSPLLFELEATTHTGLFPLVEALVTGDQVAVDLRRRYAGAEPLRSQVDQKFINSIHRQRVFINRLFLTPMQKMRPNRSLPVPLLIFAPRGRASNPLCRFESDRELCLSAKVN